MKELATNTKRTYLHLVLDLLLELKCIEGYRNVLGKFIKSVRIAGPTVLVVQREYKMELSNGKVHLHIKKCIDKSKKVLVPITQIQKCFLRGIPKREGSLIFTNVLLIHDKEIEAIIKDVKHALERHNIKL